jgi:hypothetical protein
MRVLRYAWLFLDRKGAEEELLLLRNANETIEYWKRTALDGWGHALDTALAMRISMEKPEVDIRDDVDGLIREIRDRLAQIEEMTV